MKIMIYKQDTFYQITTPKKKMERRNQLKTKQWGYQTCCPDEENTCGYYEPVD